jgi:Chaperone of endosialidase
MAVPYTFSTATGSLPLSQLDSNFSTAITIGNTAVVLGDTITTINNLTLGNVAITSVSAAFPNGYLANSNVIVGTTTLTLGSTVTSINGLSLSNVTISSGNVTISNVTTTNVTATTANVTTANVGTLVVIGDATVGGNTTVTGNITAAKGTFTSANVTGTANVQVIAVTQNATVAGNATVTGNVSAANGTFTSANVSGTANVQIIAVTQDASVAGNITATGNITGAKGTFTSANVSGIANVVTLAVVANATVGGNVSITGNISAANGTFTSANVSGTANVSTLAVISNVTIGGNATVTGNVSMNVATITTANVSGTANISTLVITANQTSLGNITATGNVTAAKLIPTGTSVTGNGLYLPAANALGLSTNGTNAVYIDASQNLLVGTTSALSQTGRATFVSSGNALVTQVGNGQTGFQSTNTSGTAIYYAAIFGNNGNSFSTCGLISVSGTTTVYAVTSDYRLKENIQPMTGALAKVLQLKPVTYQWKVDGSNSNGFIAHELAEICPQAVSGEKDALKEDGSIMPQGIDTSFLVATLTAAIQELKALTDAQANTITSLTARITALEAK